MYGWNTIAALLAYMRVCGFARVACGNGLLLEPDVIAIPILTQRIPFLFRFFLKCMKRDGLNRKEEARYSQQSKLLLCDVHSAARGRAKQDRGGQMQQKMGENLQEKFNYLCVRGLIKAPSSLA